MKTLARLAVLALALSCPAGLTLVVSAVAVCVALDLVADVAWVVFEVRSAH
jgi:hypothetical protein